MQTQINKVTFLDVFPTIDDFNGWWTASLTPLFDANSEFFNEKFTINFSKEIIYNKLVNMYSYRTIRYQGVNPITNEFSEFVSYFTKIFSDKYPTLYTKMQVFVSNELNTLSNKELRGNTIKSTGNTNTTASSDTAIGTTPSNETPVPNTDGTVDLSLTVSDGLDTKSGSRTNGKITGTNIVDDINFQGDLEKILIAKMYYPLENFLVSFNQLFVKVVAIRHNYYRGWND